MTVVGDSGDRCDAVLLCSWVNLTIFSELRLCSINLLAYSSIAKFTLCSKPTKAKDLKFKFILCGSKKMYVEV